MRYFRRRHCSCGTSFNAEVVYGPTTNLSGEKRVYCPDCGRVPAFASPHQVMTEERYGCLRCTGPVGGLYEDHLGYCGACRDYLCLMVGEQLAHYAGFTEAEWRDYAEDSYHFSPPPVCTANWDDESWMAYIFGPRS